MIWATTIKPRVSTIPGTIPAIEMRGTDTEATAP